MPPSCDTDQVAQFIQSDIPSAAAFALTALRVGEYDIVLSYLTNRQATVITMLQSEAVGANPSARSALIHAEDDLIKMIKLTMRLDAARRAK